MRLEEIESRYVKAHEVKLKTAKTCIPEKRAARIQAEVDIKLIVIVVIVVTSRMIKGNLSSFGRSFSI